jgi:hypothetical protein
MCSIQTIANVQQNALLLVYVLRTAFRAPQRRRLHDSPLIAIAIRLDTSARPGILSSLNSQITKGEEEEEEEIMEIAVKTHFLGLNPKVIHHPFKLLNL